MTDPALPLSLRIVEDDLSGAQTQQLIAHHLGAMRGTCAIDSVHALDLEALRHPSLTVWSAWHDGRLAGIGALKMLDAQRGEVKSMRVHDDFLRTGAGRAVLRHIIGVAHGRGLASLWLETGVEPRFVPAHRLYAAEGFVVCGPFADYRLDPMSTFMTLDLTG
jgi:putative acetyltransferase